MIERNHPKFPEFKSWCHDNGVKPTEAGWNAFLSGYELAKAGEKKETLYVENKDKEG